MAKSKNGAVVEQENGAVNRVANLLNGNGIVTELANMPMSEGESIDVTALSDEETKKLEAQLRAEARASFGNPKPKATKEKALYVKADVIKTALLEIVGESFNESPDNVSIPNIHIHFKGKSNPRDTAGFLPEVWKGIETRANRIVFLEYGEAEAKKLRVLQTEVENAYYSLCDCGAVYMADELADEVCNMLENPAKYHFTHEFALELLAEGPDVATASQLRTARRVRDAMRMYQDIETAKSNHPTTVTRKA